MGYKYSGITMLDSVSQRACKTRRRIEREREQKILHVAGSSAMRPLEPTCGVPERRHASYRFLGSTTGSPQANHRPPVALPQTPNFSLHTFTSVIYPRYIFMPCGFSVILMRIQCLTKRISQLTATSIPVCKRSLHRLSRFSSSLPPVSISFLLDRCLLYHLPKLN